MGIRRRRAACIFKIRNPKQTPKFEYQRLETNATIPSVGVFLQRALGHLGFEFVSDLGF